MPSKKKRPAGKRKISSEKATVNPFEVQVNRKKHDVLGQRRKSDSGRPGVSRSRAIQKRKKTLLVEYRQKNKANKLVDRRFGESEENLSVEEKMMRRFILERKRKHERSSLFNLNDEEEEGEGLTHYGRSLGEMDRFDDPVVTDEETREEEDIGETHFGGFMKKRPLREDENEEAAPKTRKQILDEIVSKSKAMKYERQSERMEVENLMEKVDSDWKTVHALLPKAEEGRKNSVDDYDRSIRELTFERRGQAVDRLKSEEELALERKKRLEKLEADRIRRMKGHSSDESGGEEGEEGNISEEGEEEEEGENISEEEEEDISEEEEEGENISEEEGNICEEEEEGESISEEEENISEEEEENSTEEESLGTLLDYCVKLGGHLTPHNLAILDTLVSPLFKLVKLDAHHAATVFSKVLATQHKEWMQKKKNLPPFSTLVILQLAGLLFSASDYHHPVTTPAFLFMAQSLAQSQVKSVLELLHGLIQCDIMLQYIRDSKRFVPELVNFLSSAVGCFSKNAKCVFLPPFTPKSKVRQELASTVEDAENLMSSTLLEMLAMLTDQGSTPVSRCDILKIVVEMNSRLVELYRDSPSFPELFAPLKTNLLRVALTKWPAALQDSIQALEEKYAELAARPRDTLQLLKQKPKSIKFYEPKFDAVYEVSKRRHGVKSARETQKLKYKLKRETKGAIRELKKDAAFMAKVKLKETLQLDAERQRKTRQLMHELQTQQHEAKVERLRTKKR